MANINQLPDIITLALTGSNNQQRTQAEADILYLRDLNPTVFFLKCAQLIEEENNSSFIRQSSGTVLGRLILLKVRLFITFLEPSQRTLLLGLNKQQLEIINQKKHPVHFNQSKSVNYESWSKRDLYHCVDIVATIRMVRLNWNPI
jgi:hypothetical protein